MIAALPQGCGERLTSAMATIERLLGASGVPPAPAILRDPGPGDMGWVVQSHGSLYAREYGFDASFESLVAEITAKFLTSFDASRERCWIAELDGTPVGSVFLVRHSDDVAKLRLLLIDPAARGQGLGQRMVAECLSFAKARGYRKVTLWTQSILVAARKIYSGRRICPRGLRTASRFRPGPDRRDLGARAVTRHMTRPMIWQRRDLSRRATLGTGGVVQEKSLAAAHREQCRQNWRALSAWLVQLVRRL